MNLVFDDAHAEVLRDVLDDVLGDLSSEIADTDNPAYRQTLRQRRSIIQDVRNQLA